MAEEKKRNGTPAKGAYQNKKKKSVGAPSGSAKQAPSGSAKQAASKKNRSAVKSGGGLTMGHQITMILLAILAIFIAICFIFPNSVGLLGYGLAAGFFGVFGIAAFLVPFLMLLIIYFWKRDVLSGAIRYRYLFAIGVLLMFSIIIHTFRGMALREEYTFATSFLWETLSELFVDGMEYQGGGFVGGILASLLICSFGYPGALIFGFLLLFILIMLLFGLTPAECVRRSIVLIRRIREKNKIRKEKRAIALAAKKEKERLRAEAEAAYEDEEYDEEEEDEYEDEDEDGGTDDECADDGDDMPVPAAVPRQNYRDISIHMGSEKPSVKEEPKEPVGEAVPEAYAEEPAEETVPAQESADEKKLAWDPDTSQTAEIPLSYEEEADGDDADDGEDGEDGIPEEIEILPPDPMVDAPLTVDDEVPEEIPEPPEYIFPTTDLLQPPEEVNTDEGVAEELRENADRIIDTLESFHVHVNISHVSRGPTVTRYELEPAAGTRVRSITNLLDDIALSLATSGVRSDGIITGKSAIGIEVPNKIVNTVYIRELIEDERFVDAKSRLTTCLGMDVSGAPVYLDIAKMPHLLIAGATGMGKSVCINSLLVSLLYKARPDEVKLILIDPKKVELNIYNGIPHLLVPVVFDPKKAAGSLHWAVTEMERRFELIESKNTRNIAQYNALVADDPTQEFLPQIVIIIDELADLMMNAPDDVETSICRLAQKARAAGMHLIIGTQRPSVDVITGLIKANIPSRIAFTVASQIDSRTIIDAQGAEKLIGRGDMLYAPVGSAKPIRVQGAFVSETEIEEIVDFIRDQSFGTTYSDEVMAQINRAAELCGQKKGKGVPTAASDAGADDNDPMLDSAIALAVEMGKISTSLIQRRLQLGYGRAAKIIDMMERRGIVSAPDGQKPRAVLITREQYLEMQMKNAEKAETEEAPF